MSAPLCRHCDAELDVDNIDQVRALDGCKIKLWVGCGECERDTAFVLEREADALHDAFRAGAEYMRRSSRIVHDEVPAIGSAYQSGRDFVRVPRMEMPERIDAAAAGYVEGLSGPAGDTDEPGADPRMTGGAS